MARTCSKCGGLLIGESPMDFYQARCWKCVNCGWCREEKLVPPCRVISSVRHPACRWGQN